MDQEPQPTLGSQPSAPQMPPQPSSDGMSYDTKVIIVIICLLMFYPVGVILMWAWMKTWPTWVKLLISLLLILPIIAIMAAILLVAINPTRQIERAREAQMRQEQYFSPAPEETVVPFESPSPVATRSVQPRR